MPARKFYCDYCDKQFPDTAADRKRHERGIQHQQAKARWYDSFKLEQQQQFPSNAPLPQGMPQPLCYNFVNTGFCRYGNSCKYLHPNANNAPHPSMISAPNPSGNVVLQDRTGLSWDNLPPSLQPPPEAGYPSLPFVDWG
ncbi:zinc finger CCCH domain-containing protein 3 [Arachis duranensis]|uniref:Zinc finger CCCH domain-containing protein 3 n=1 Tax=Arachis duranensis TaxID=130453 RepID=A0A6P4BGS9_ARADU|nr:zinc finger CCCH domain-containing protein 3 [Arachis duranensis]XP_015939589.1 zinc finger CCCH domain-containing protein 3 [Arachis duranensis]XP_052110541.1 zinc finger CCCH domain-containing protein 3 [Arachis duranensis]XP_052110542.1 zinc finger CCCH domain-containing protein 3 [Arachis duranensis]